MSTLLAARAATAFNSLTKRAVTTPRLQASHLTNRTHSTVATNQNLFSAADAEVMSKKIETLQNDMLTLKNSTKSNTAGSTTTGESFGNAGIVLGAMGVALAATAATIAGVSYFSSNVKSIDKEVKKLALNAVVINAELNRKIDANHAELNRKIDANHAELNRKIDANHAELKADMKDLNHKMDKQDAAIAAQGAKIDQLLARKSSWL